MRRREIGVAVAIVLTGLPPSAWTAPPEGVTVEALEKRGDALVARFPADRYDPDALAATLGPGVEPAFAWVRDRVRVEAYPGVLRGERIALGAGAANAYDRSLLLAALLRAKGVPVRFALGRLGDEPATRLFARVFERPAAPPGPPPSPDSILARVSARGERDYATIRKALGDPVGGAVPSTRDAALEDLRDHAWVQAKVEDAWVDLDASFPDAAPGKAYATANATLDAFPDEAYQRVTLRVVAETLSGDRLAEETCLEWSSTVADAVDSEIYLLHAPPKAAGPGDAIGLAVASAAGGEQWIPALWVEGESWGGKPIAFTDAPPAARRGGPPGGGLGGLFGPGGALGSHKELVAEWLECVVTAPRRAPDATRRALVDRADPAWRTAASHPREGLRPLPRAEQTLLTPRQVHNVWITAGAHDLHAYAQALRAVPEVAKAAAAAAAAAPVEGAPAAPAAPAERTFADQVWPWAVRNFGFLVLADHVVRAAADEVADVRLYVGSPRVTIFSAGLGADGFGTSTIDLHRDRLVGVARTPESDRVVVERKMRAGAFAGALEHEALRDLVAVMEGTPRLVTTSALGEPGVVGVRPGGAGDARVPGVARAAVASALAAGRAVVVPTALDAKGWVGWWEVEPDGATRAVLAPDLGGGSADQIGPRLPNGQPNTRVPPGTVPREPPVYPHGRPPGPPPRRPVPPDNIGPRRPGGGNPTSTTKKAKGGGNEYLMVILHVSLEAVLVFALGYFAHYIVEAGVYLGERLYVWLEGSPGI